MLYKLSRTIQESEDSPLITQDEFYCIVEIRHIEDGSTEYKVLMYLDHPCEIPVKIFIHNFVADSDESPIYDKCLNDFLARPEYEGAVKHE